MNTLSLSLFGHFQANWNDNPIASFRTRKVQALLIYLVAEPAAHRRESLMELLWPGMPERSARQNLRQILYNLQQEISSLSPEEYEPGKPNDEQTIAPLIVNRQTIQLNPQASVTADVFHFASHLNNVRTHSHVDLLICHFCRQQLEQAIALYSGEFLADFYLDDSNEFEEWAESQRHTYRRQALDALEILTTITTRQRAFPQARAYAEQQLEMDYLRESAYRQLMEILALHGHREEALALYERCQRLLADELGMAPTSRTTDIYHKILSGDLHFDTPQTQGVRGYELKEEIGEGAHGAIYRAVQPSIGREVAVKVIRRKYANDSQFIRRFEVEAQTIARLEHPYIVPLYDYWRDPEGAYLVMRLLRGGDLLTALAQGQWDVDTAARMLDQIASALTAAHRQGIVHRDIKPANILFDDAGNAYLSDFGIAKDLKHEWPLTAEGGLVGTPDYISPEQLRNEPVTPQSDLYSLGAVLYETLAGERPFANTPFALRIQKHLQEPLPLVSANRPDLPIQIDEVIQCATAKQPSDRYPDALAMAAAFRRAVRGASSTNWVIPTDGPTALEITNPYKGLRAFQESDASDFYGRDTLIEQLISRLTDNRFLAVVGPSGSGKSSLVKAGLIPALRQEALPGSDKWFVAEMVPGTHPLEELEQALIPIAVDPPPSLLEPMQKDERGILRTIRRVLPDEEGAQVLLVIDQFEELFTLVESEEKRIHFLNSLLVALQAHRSPLRIVVTLRADFYDRPLQIESIAGLFKQHTEIILPLTREELTWAIQEPARQMGVSIEGEVITEMVADAVNQPGALPLFQYTLTELFEDRHDHMMTMAAYRALGGVTGSLAQRAEELYDSMDETEKEVSRQLFLRLVTLGEGIEDTRRRVRLSELDAVQSSENGDGNPRQKTSAVLDIYGRYRLLTFDRDPLTREPTVEVAHEALLREWPRLRRWLDQSRDEVRMQRRLAAAASEWNQASREEDYLLRGSRLDLFSSWVLETDLALTQDEQAFLAASNTAHQQRQAKEETRRQRELETARQLAETEREAAQRLRQRAILLAGALVVAAVLAVLALLFGRQAQQVAREATSRELAGAALANITIDPERGILLALAGLSSSPTLEAKNALHAALPASRAKLTLIGHEAEVWGVAYHPDGSQLATGSLDGTIKLWDTTSGQELLTFSDESRAVYGLAYSPDGTHLAASSENGSASVWDVETGTRLLTLAGHEGPVYDVAFSADGRYLATGGRDATVKIWDATSGNMLLVLSGYQALVNYVTFSPDSHLLAAGGEGGVVKIWDVASLLNEDLDASNDTSGRELANLPSGDRAHNGPAFSPDGKLLATGTEGGFVRIWDVESSIETGSGKELFSMTGHSAPVLSLAFSPDGTQVASGSYDGTVKVWQVETGQELFTLAGHTNGIFHIAFSPDGAQLASGSWDGTAKMWDLEPEKELLTLVAHPGGFEGATSIALLDNTRIATTGQEGTAKIWTVDMSVPGSGAQQLIMTLNHGAPIWDVAVSPDDKYLATAGDDNTAKIWDLTSGQELFTLTGHLSGTAEVPYNGVTGVDFSPDGNYLATVGADGTARLWNPATGQAVHIWNAHNPDYSIGSPFLGATDVVFHPDGTKLATAGTDDNIVIWDVVADPDSGTVSVDKFLTLSGQEGDISEIAFNHDGSRLISGSMDATARVWDTESGELLLTLSDHNSPVFNVAFGPKGRWIATGTLDGTTKVWDAKSGELWLTLPGHGGIVQSLAFSENETRLAVAEQDGMVRFYVLPLEELTALAKSRVTRAFTETECQQYLHTETCPEE